MIDDKLHTETVQQLQAEIKRLQRLVFQSAPSKPKGLLRLWASKPQGHGGVTDYELWLRGLDYKDLDKLASLYTGAVDSLRFRKRFVEHEVTRRHLHSEYGKHSLEHLTEVTKGLA